MPDTASPPSRTSQPGTPPRPPQVWLPPVWLLAVNTVGMVALALGLILQFAPESSTAQSLPAWAALPLLAFGGVTFLLAWYAMLRLLLSARQRRR